MDNPGHKVRYVASEQAATKAWMLVPAKVGSSIAIINDSDKLASGMPHPSVVMSGHFTGPDGRKIFSSSTAPMNSSDAGEMLTLVFDDARVILHLIHAMFTLIMSEENVDLSMQAVFGLAGQDQETIFSKLASQAIEALEEEAANKEYPLTAESLKKVMEAMAKVTAELNEDRQ